MIDRDCTLIDIATIVAEGLRRDRIDSILVGGSAVTAHDDSIHVSRDADFVAAATNAELAPTMTALGFRRSGFTWTHPSSEYTVQFVSGAAAIGARLLHDFEVIRNAHGVFKTLRLQDAVEDRLLKFIVWDDREARQIALRLIRKHPASVDVGVIAQHLGLESPTPDMKRKLASILRSIKEY